MPYPIQGSGGLRASGSPTVTGRWVFQNGIYVGDADAVNYNRVVVRVVGGRWFLGEEIGGTGSAKGLDVVAASGGNLRLMLGASQVALMDSGGFTITGRVTVQGGEVQALQSQLTAGTMTKASDAYVRRVFSKFTWTNAQVVALGAALTGDILVCTLPAKTVVLNAYLIVDTQAAGVTTLTGALGRTGATYLDYIGDSDLKAAANTVYGDAAGERGANMTGHDLPSYTGTTDVKVHFIATGANLDQVTGCTGTVILETALLP